MTINPFPELETLVARDAELRTRLAESGELFGHYHPAVAELHRENARRLREILADHGWPDRARHGEAAVEAAWLIVQHAIGEPEFQRSMLPLLEEQARLGRIRPALVAMLEDRIRAFEGRPQLYGTQMDWDERGELSPWPAVGDPEDVDRRRASVGLPPLAENIRRLRDEARQSGERPPADLAGYREAAQAWARSVGWHS